VALATNRCASLKAKGLLTTSATAEQAEESLDKLLAAGWQPESNILHASHYATAVEAIVMAYANAYGRFSVGDNLCGLSYAATDAANKPVAVAPATLAQIFATFNGVGLSSGINVINNLNPGGPLRNQASASPSSGTLDFNADGANCLRNLWIGTDASAGRVKAGVQETLRTANLRGKPAIIVAGRADTLVPVNFNARPYYGQNKLVEGAASKLVYIEVTNAQHFDLYIDNVAVPGYDVYFVPLHYYFIQAMDRMWAYLAFGTQLPPSQVMRTTPRGGTPGAAPPITAANVPQIPSAPLDADLITFSGNTVTIPD
jgi:hydroxybutyrate-dimer hydrolase